MDDHFPVSEFACRSFRDLEGKVWPAEPYPQEWEATRLPALKRTLEIIRHEAGDHPVHVLCGYRSVRYNLYLRERGLQGERHATGVALHSQHEEGRAADIAIFGMTAHVLHGLVLELREAGKLPELGGVGNYPSLGFVHIDTYKLASGELRKWNG